MRTLRDALDTVHVCDAPRKRIVSLVPSETESVVLCGWGDRLVGRTDYCVRPIESLHDVPTIGGTKNPSLAAILALRPDLVLANKEENTPEIVRQLEAHGVSVHTSFPCTIVEARALLDDLVSLIAPDEASPAVLHALDQTLREVREVQKVQALQEARESHAPIRGFCPIWMEPLMTLNDDTFISDVLECVGVLNVFGTRRRRYPLAADLGHAPELNAARTSGRDVRYPRITHDELRAAQPDVLILPSEPHPFTQEDARAFEAMDVRRRDGRSAAIVFVDGADLCWYSPRMGEGILRLRKLIEAVV